jgi:hypothetical protein
VVCDIGGQDIKVLFMQNGDIKNFRLSNQCSAGNGMLLQAMADQFGVKITEYADTAFAATLSPKFSYGCAVFLDSDRVNFQKEGYSKEELLAGLAQVLPKNVWQYVVQIPRMAALGKKFVLQGGTQYNLAAVKAQVDYIKERVPGAEVFVHPHCGEAGAIGAAFETLRVVKRRGHSTFIGMDSPPSPGVQARNDESTRCHFCPTTARAPSSTRTRPTADRALHQRLLLREGHRRIEDAMLALAAERKKLMKQFPNLVDTRGEACCSGTSTMRARCPRTATPKEDVDVRRPCSGFVARPPRAGSAVEPEALERRRARCASASPRCSTSGRRRRSGAPTSKRWACQKQNVVFSDDTSEEMWIEGGKYGSIDPCYPSKVGQAHIHNLLFHHHSRRSR